MNLVIISLSITNIITGLLLVKEITEKKFNKEKLNKIQELEEEINTLMQHKGRLEELTKNYKNLTHEYKNLQEDNKTLLSENNKIEKLKELLKQEKNTLLKEKEEWGKDKKNLLKKLTLELIQKNSEINDKNSKQNQEKIKNITEKLLKNFENVTNKVFSLDDRDKKREKEFHTITKGLLHPGGAGLSAEITLENILKASGLIQKKTKEDSGDYILQTSFNTKSSEDPTKRPDAIIYLPNNHHLIIDSKSSSHFIELQNAIDNKNKEKEKIILQKIKKSMEKHLEDLKSKDYQKAQLKYLETKDSKTPPTIATYMFLQTEKMLDIIRKIDKNFELKCQETGIPVLTPITLINLLNMSKYSIYKEIQDKNIEKLKEEVKKLLNNVNSLFKNAGEIGKGLKKAINSYDKFAGIFNKNILLRAKAISKLGIKAKNKLPSKLEQYELATTTIEGEVKEIKEEDNSNNLLEE